VSRRMDPRNGSPPGSPRGRDAFDQAVSRSYATARTTIRNDEVWKQDLIFWLNQELPRRRGAVAEDGQGTALYDRGVEWGWVLVFGANVRGTPAWSPLPPFPATHALYWPAAARFKWAAHV
jgi:hypothetical protein